MPSRRKKTAPTKKAKEKMKVQQQQQQQEKPESESATGVIRGVVPEQLYPKEMLDAMDFQQLSIVYVSALWSPAHAHQWGVFGCIYYFLFFPPFFPFFSLSLLFLLPFVTTLRR